MGGQRSKRESGQVSPAHLGPQEPAEILGLILCPLRPPQALQVLREWEGGKGSKSKGRTYRMAPLRGGWGRGGVPTSSRTHPQLGVQRGQGRPWGRGGWGAWRKGREHGQHFPCPLRHWEACWAPGPNPLPSEPPSCHAEPKPHPYTPTQGPTSTLGDPF